MKAIKTLFLSLALIVFLLFVEMNVYQILYPAWYAECRVGGVFVRATCSEDKACAEDVWKCGRLQGFDDLQYQRQQI